MYELFCRGALDTVVNLQMSRPICCVGFGTSSVGIRETSVDRGSILRNARESRIQHTQDNAQSLCGIERIALAIG